MRHWACFSTSTTDRVLMELTPTDLSVKVITLLEPGSGKVALEKDQLGTGVTTTVFNTPNLADGSLRHLVDNELFTTGSPMSSSSTAPCIPRRPSSTRTCGCCPWPRYAASVNQHGIGTVSTADHANGSLRQIVAPDTASASF